MNSKHIQHLYWRAGFGINPKEFAKVQHISKNELVNNLFKASKTSTPLQIDTSFYSNTMADYKDLNASQKKQLQKENRKQIEALNIAWVERIGKPKELLRERMTLFWANVFVCKAQNAYHIQNFNNILRNNALGNFRDFVIEISKSASMLNYLNAKQNKKQSPNENFARELMELFTLGIGNYSENDIKESARAFTGWNYKPNGDFFVNKNQHDNGEKTFFSKTGNFDGVDIINIILDQKQCATFICEKIYSNFVNTNLNKTHINAMVEVFFPNYNIETLMHFVFISDWFYNEENIGSKIKSPIELLAGINNTIPIQFQINKQLLYLQKVLGQQLLNPVNVAGWKGGQSWIDTNTLMFRLKLPSILLNNAVISLEGISEFEDTYEEYLKNRQSKKGYLKINQNWVVFEENYKSLTAEEMQKNIISSTISPNAKMLLDEIEFSNHKDYCIQLMSLPEYQLC